MTDAPSFSTEGHAPRSSRRGLLKVTVAALVLGAVGVAAYRHESAPQPAPDAGAPAPVPVVTAAVRKQDVPIILTGVGTVNALNVATIRSQVTGYLQSVDFTEGQFVRRGDVLTRIDPRIYQARLEQAQALLAKDQALLANQKTNLARNEPLLQKGFATDQQVVSERAMIAQTESALKGDQAAIDYAQTELDFTTLRAPFDGVTGIRRIDIGNIVNPTDTSGIVVLTQVQPISVLFTLPTSDIAAVWRRPPDAGTGTGSEIRQPLGYAIVGGLAVSQVLTLFTTPVVYLYMDKLRLSLTRHPPTEARQPVVEAR